MDKYNFNIQYCLDSQLEVMLKELIDYYNKSDYYKALKEGAPARNAFVYMGILANTHMYLQLTPGRANFNLTEKNDGTLSFKEKHGKNCALVEHLISRKMHDNLSIEKNLLWRGYLIKPNTFPYFDVHYLVMASSFDCENPSLRGSQNDFHVDPNLIRDMLDFYLLQHQKGFMFYNGMIGNSQLMFHFHYTTHKSLLKCIIEEINDMKYEKLKSKKGTTLTIFHSDGSPCYSGVIFYGKKEDVAEEVFKYVGIIYKKKWIYNLVIVPSVDKDKVEVIVYIRKKVDAKTREKEEILMNDFGVNYGTLIRNEVNKSDVESGEIAKDLQKYCKASFIKSSKALIKNLG